MAEPASLQDPPSLDEVMAVGSAIATAVAPEGGLTGVQVAVLEAVTHALTGVSLDYRALPPLGPEQVAASLEDHDLAYKRRIVQHMVLGELVLRPLPAAVAERVGSYATALGVDDEFVRLARRYAQGAYGLAWVDLRRNGFADRWSDDTLGGLHTAAAFEDPFDDPVPDPELEARWEAFATLPEGTLGRSVWEMYDSRGFALPGNAHGAPAFIAQHDFVHVLAEYGTNLEGELEVFALIARADPDPKGFAWLATMIGLFETGYVHEQGFFKIDVRDRNLESPGMGVRLADALRRGKEVAESYGTDLFLVDYHAVAGESLDVVRAQLDMPPKSEDALESGSAGVFELAGMSATQRAAFEAKAGHFL
jgi:hypothetical protein